MAFSILKFRDRHPQKLRVCLLFLSVFQGIFVWVMQSQHGKLEASTSKFASLEGSDLGVKFYDSERDDWETGWVITKYALVTISVGWILVSNWSLPDAVKAFFGLATLIASIFLSINQMSLRNFLNNGESIVNEACAYTGGFQKFYEANSHNLLPIVGSISNLDQ